MKKFIKRNLSVLALIYSLASTATLAQSPPSYTISGYVHDAAGHNVSGVRVCTPSIEDAGYLLCATSDANGRFTIKVKDAGKYQLFPSKSSEGYVPHVLPFYKHPSVPITEVTLDGSNTSSFSPVLLGPKNGALAGVSIDAATSLPVENAQFILCHAASPQICFSTSAKSADGKFRVSAPHVPFTLKITAEGYEDWFGLTGSDPHGAITVPSGTTTEFVVYLKRRKEAVNKALSEAEKKPGVNLAAPLQLSPADNVELNDLPRATKLEWAPVDGAASYTVEIDYCRGDQKDKRECIKPQPLTLEENPPMSGLVKTTYEFLFLGAQPGRWRVWAVDERGREGFKSPWRTFFYLR